jgi:hypothetical protein
MARQVQTVVTLLDDMNGTPFLPTEGTMFDLVISRKVGDETTVQRFTLDLAAENAAAFEKAISKFVAKGHEVAPRAAKSASNGDPEASHIRAHARANGVEVASQGRIGAAVKQAWLDAGSPHYNEDGSAVAA